MIKHFRKRRRCLIVQALDDAKKWCAPPERRVDKTKYSDQHWLKLFATASEVVTQADVHDFLVSFQLARARKWDKQAVAARIVAFRDQGIVDIPAAVSALAEDLSACMAKSRGLQTSAASKVAFFTLPKHEVFIWDRLLIQSARFREWVRMGGQDRPKRFDRSYTVGRVPSYAAYSTACAEVLGDERTQPDFCDAVSMLTTYLQRIGGPMKDSISEGASSFVERRFLDKLMWWEGQHIENVTTNPWVLND